MNKNELETRLATIDLFQGVPKRALRQVINAGRETEHADGHEVIAEGSGTVGFHLITRGKARVSSAALNRTLGAGDYFGEISVIDGKPRSASVTAVGSLQTFLVHPHTFQTLMDTQPAFTRRLLVLLCGKLREADRGTK